MFILTNQKMRGISMHFYIQHFSKLVYHKEDGLYVLDNDLYAIVEDETGAVYVFTLYKGFKSNGGSVPKVFRWFMPSWDDDVPLLCISYLLHDWLYASAELPKKIADDMLRGLLRDAGYNRFHASTVCWAVNTFAKSHYGKDEYGVAKLGNLEITP